MFVKVLAKVTKVEEQSEYISGKGSQKYVEADLDIQDNKLNINGTITIRENLSLGAFYWLVIDTREPAIQTSQGINEVGEAMLQAATEVSHG